MSENMRKKSNRLVKEKSPYLLQHAYNPVEWYPWCEEAFEKAKKEDKPIFLSVGYSCCHWCHVMERESFENEDVAKILNKNFISIKVDREERPDIDNIYMSVCQALTGSGGWPLSVFLTPDKKPFYAGTYFPKENKYGRIGFINILNEISGLWNEKRDEVINKGDYIVEKMKIYEATGTEKELDNKVIENTYKLLKKSFEPHYGGFSTAPKFPMPHNLMFLMRYYKNTGEETALHLVEKTLLAMYKGGIFDHVGYGFSRYSTDNKWLIPHFEKMLYDNALLSIAYTEAYALTKKEIYKEIAEKIFTYILREMTDPEGGFYSAEDADSEGVEGKFYVWTKEEIDRLLEVDSELFSKLYDITELGNFEEKNIPNLINRTDKELELGHIEESIIERSLLKLFENREKRIHPHKDDKILTSWNGLMIAALSFGGRILSNSTYIEAAKNAVRFLFNNLIREDRRLLARYREQSSDYEGYLSDYAFLIWGLIELYETTFDAEYLKKAKELNEQMIELFWDKEKGGLFLNGKDAEKLIWRPKEIYDGAIPSGNSVALLNIIRLSNIFDDYKLAQKADELIKAFSSNIDETPNAYTYLVMALMSKLYGRTAVVIAGEKNEKNTKEFIDLVRVGFNPFTDVLLNDKDMWKLNESLQGKKKLGNEVTVYVCKDFQCLEPVKDKEKLKKLLTK
ncbi:thioredoxin domain-containing protein [Clostridium sediminicola]|uniref:thioredoxin domain-containing protein n=1 Tax=Clostridium sediminicola TaxID=3114879 RepID=UPI0031F273B8